MSSSKQSPDRSPSGGPNSARPIKMKDLAAFKWLIINMFGHDYMHDYLINTGRCSKSKSIIDQINKLVSIIANYKREKTSKIRTLFGDLDMAGGGKKLQKGGVGLSEDDDLSSPLIKYMDFDSSVTISYVDDIESSINIHTQISNQLDVDISSDSSPFPELKDGSKPQLHTWWIDNRDGEHKELAENIYLIVQEELYIDTLIVHGMQKNFEVLSEILIGNILNEPIKNIIELTTSVGKFLNYENNQWEEEDERSYPNSFDEIQRMDTDFKSSDGILGIKHTDREYDSLPIAGEIKNRLSEVTFANVNKQILGNLLKLKERGGSGSYNIKNKNLSDITSLQLILDSYVDGEKEEETQLLQNMSEKLLYISGDEDDSSDSNSISSSEEKHDSQSASDESVDIIISNSGLFDFTKKVIFGEILKICTGADATLSLFDGATLKCHLYDISLNSIKKLSTLFYGIYKSTIIDVDHPTFIDENNYFFEDTRKQQLMLLIKNVNDIFEIIDSDDSIKIQFNAIIEPVLIDINSVSFKALFRFVLLNFHPDKITGLSSENNDKITNIFAEILTNLSNISKSFGGGKTMKGGKKDKDKDVSAFIGLNKLLGKTILENSLSLMNCVNGNKTLGYFPNIRKISGAVDGNYKTFYKNYPGIKPRFVNIFNGEGIFTEMESKGYYDITKNSIIWDAICPTSYSPGKVENGAPLEFRKLLARRILLNIQVLILYLKCSPGSILTSTLLNGLYLTIDKTPRNYDTVRSRGFWGPAKKSHQDAIKKYIQFQGDDGGQLEIKEFVRKNRSKWFGFMFDFYKKAPPTIKNKTWNEFTTPPLWLTNGNFDDALQFSFNIVLQHLLPEFILYMGEHDMFNGSVGRIDFIKKNNEGVSSELPLPTPSVTGDKSYIISNASKFIFPSQKKVNDKRFGLFNLSGQNTRDLNYCPITSIADNQPTCSVTIDKTANNETYPRSHEYDLEMSVEAEDAIGQTYSYVIEMTKIGSSRTSYYISAALSMPLHPSILIGDKTEINDLKGSPLGAVSTYFTLLKSMSKELKKGSYLAQFSGSRLPPRDILQNFFKTNMEMITKMSVKKSIGDYGQEHVASCKFGSGIPSEVMDPNNGYDRVLPYSDDGDSLRIMLANDRPSAYRNIFMLLFSEENHVNSRAVAGYWNENPISSGGAALPTNSLKNTIVISPSTVLPEALRSGDSVFNTSTDTDAALGLVKSAEVIDQNNKFRQEEIRKKIRNVGYIKERRRKRNNEYASRRRSTRGFTKWLKNQPSIVHERLSEVGTYMKKSLMEKLKYIYIGPDKGKTISPNSSGNGWIMTGGKRKHKKRKRKTKKNKRRKNKTKRKRKNKKHKSKKKRHKKHRNTKRIK